MSSVLFSMTGKGGGINFLECKMGTLFLKLQMLKSKGEKDGFDVKIHFGFYFS